MKRKKGLILNKSYNDYILGNNINDYLYKSHSVRTMDVLDSHESLYYFYNDKIDIWCNSDGVIETITCVNSCLYKGIDLIGMNFKHFLILISSVPDKEENIYHIIYGRGRTDHVYDFFSLGLQIWVWRNKIRNVTIYNNNVEPDP